MASPSRNRLHVTVGFWQADETKHDPAVENTFVLPELKCTVDIVAVATQVRYHTGKRPGGSVCIVESCLAHAESPHSSQKGQTGIMPDKQS